MKHSKVSIRFSSEAHFEKFSFDSEIITVKEIIEYLSQKKKLDSDKKMDRIALFYDGDMTQEIKTDIVVFLLKQAHA